MYNLVLATCTDYSKKKDTSLKIIISRIVKWNSFDLLYRYSSSLYYFLSSQKFVCIRNEILMEQSIEEETKRVICKLIHVVPKVLLLPGSEFNTIHR